MFKIRMNATPLCFHQWIISNFVHYHIFMVKLLIKLMANMFILSFIIINYWELLGDYLSQGINKVESMSTNQTHNLEKTKQKQQLNCERFQNTPGLAY